MIETTSRYGANRLLAAMPVSVLSQIAAEFESVVLEHGHVLLHSGVAAQHAYFPDAGLVSMVKVMRDGRSVEIGAVGNEGLVGANTVFGTFASAFDMVVQVEGRARRIDANLLHRSVEASAEAKGLIMRYLAYREIQYAQTAACNRLHTLRQRCCRWLLTAYDNSEGDVVRLTHDFLALMMGVTRPALSLILENLQRQGLIERGRGSLAIRNRQALADGACECYEALRAEAESFLRFGG